jgi:hypothetical protein
MQRLCQAGNARFYANSEGPHLTSFCDVQGQRCGKRSIRMTAGRNSVLPVRARNTQRKGVARRGSRVFDEGHRRRTADTSLKRT